MRVAGTVAATLLLVCPALAQGGTNGAAVALPTFEYVVPTAIEALPAKDEAGSSEQQVPVPTPNGCPFRGGKLELIV